jgi:hypothetical protein
MTILYLLLAWVLISFIGVIVLLKLDYYKNWTWVAFAPGLLLFYLLLIIREFFYKIRWQIKRQESKYNQRL